MPLSAVWLKITEATGARLYGLLLSVATLALTARLLGPEGRGQLATVLAWVALLVTFGHLSFGQVAIHRLSRESKRESVGDLVSCLLACTVFVSLGCGFASAALIWTGKASGLAALPTPLLVIGMMMLPFAIWEQYGQSLLMGIDRARLFNRATMVGRTVNFAAVFVLVGALGWGTTGALLSALTGAVIISAGGLRELLTLSGRLSRPRKAVLKVLLQGSGRLHLNAIGTYLFSQSGTLVVSHYHNASTTGNYQLAAQLFAVLGILPTAITQVLYGVVATQGPDGGWNANKAVLHRALLISGVVIVAAWAFSPFLVSVVAGPGFEDAANYFRAMLPILLAGTLSAAMAPQWIGRGYFWRASLITMAIGVCGFSVSIFLTPRIGAYGAIVGSGVAYSIGLLSNLALYLYCEHKSKANVDGDKN